MSQTGLETFDTTLQKTSIWLGDIMQELESEDRQRAYAALRAVLHALRDRLTVEEAVNLGAQLPMLVRGIYYEGWRPAGKPLRYRHKDEFLEEVAHKLHFPGTDDIDLEKASRAVFKVLAAHVTEGEIEEVINQLPAPVREMWH